MYIMDTYKLICKHLKILFMSNYLYMIIYVVLFLFVNIVIHTPFLMKCLFSLYISNLGNYTCNFKYFNTLVTTYIYKKQINTMYIVDFEWIQNVIHYIFIVYSTYLVVGPVIVLCFEIINGYKLILKYNTFAGQISVYLFHSTTVWHLIILNE